MDVRAYGPAAVMVDLANSSEVAALGAALDGARGVLETMPGLRTVLVRFDPQLTDGARIAQTCAGVDLSARAVENAGQRRTVRIRYDGADLDEVADRTGLHRDEVVAAHQACAYRVALIGMAPGFYFLTGGDPRLQVPRRRTPRTDVPKGAVGLAGEHTGIYPRTGPGGWQLIGTVLDDLWHPSDLPAALLAPGDLVRFESA